MSNVWDLQDKDHVAAKSLSAEGKDKANTVNAADNCLKKKIRELLITSSNFSFSKD